MYLITLDGPLDDLPVALFATQAEVDAFIESNPPAPVDGRDVVDRGPLRNAARVAGYGPNKVFGYSVWKIVDGVPVKRYMRQWTEDQWPGPAEWEDWDGPHQDAFTADLLDEDWTDVAQSNQEEWDYTI